jgi:hypothetical protein
MTDFGDESAFESLAERVISQLPEEEMSYETVDLSQKVWCWKMWS